MVRFVFIIWCLFATIPLYSQLQDSIAVHIQIIVENESDTIRLAEAVKVASFLEALPYGKYDVANEVRYLKYTRCPNAEVELFSWSVPLTKGNAYYNLFKYPDNKNYWVTTIPGEKNNFPNYLFYDLLAFKSEEKEYLVLFGWSTTRQTDNKALFIARTDKMKRMDFNNPLLMKGEQRSSSYIMQYSKGMSVMLKHDKKGKRILFDHLSASEAEYEGVYAMYGPDGTYSAFLLKKGKWMLAEEIKL